MGLFSKVGRLILYPALKPVEQLKEASEQIKKDLAASRQARSKHNADLAERARQFAQDGQAQLTEEQLLNPQLITDPRRRFEALYQLNAWTPQELEEQLVAARRARRFALAAGAALVIGALANLIFSPVWLLLILSPCLFVGCVLCLVNSFKYGLFQWQIEDRCLYGPKDYMSRPDFLQHIRS